MSQATFLPATVFEEFRKGIDYKASLGSRGLYEQTRINERFYVGDQWKGANCGTDRPLVRHNVIKRIGDYKMAMVGNSPVTVNYLAEGVPDTLNLREHARAFRERAAKGEDPAVLLQERVLSPDEEVNLIMNAMSSYFKVTAERVDFSTIRETALKNAYISGTGLVYTYWDSDIATGLYADAARRVPIKGDIACEVLDIENVYFGDPVCDDIQKQPYILMTKRLSVDEARRMAKKYGRSAAEQRAIVADEDDIGNHEFAVTADGKCTVITKLWREYDDAGVPHIYGAVVCRGAVIRPKWKLPVRIYPLAQFTWEKRRGCGYGESEITYLIPNQIAINRMITASVWAVMVMGMPIMLVNGDVVTGPVTNDPGQIIKVIGTSDEMQSAVRYVTPPNFSPQFDNLTASLISNTLTQSGANDVVLGDVNPTNTSAIIAVRESATMPLNTVQNRYYRFIEDIARIWAEFWVTQYGPRSLKIDGVDGSWYMPFDGNRYQDLIISTRVDVGAAAIWSESQSVQTLDSLFDRQVIDPVQYLSRLPKGVVPNLDALIHELQQKTQTTLPVEETVSDDEIELVAGEIADQMLAQHGIQAEG